MPIPHTAAAEEIRLFLGMGQEIRGNGAGVLRLGLRWNREIKWGVAGGVRCVQLK